MSTLHNVHRHYLTTPLSGEYQRGRSYYQFIFILMKYLAQLLTKTNKTVNLINLLNLFKD